MIKEKANKVEDILREYPESRDNDNDLVAKYWHTELSQMKRDEGTRFILTHREISLFYKVIQSGILSQADTITRARRKIQEEIPALRGEKYNKRHSATEIVKEEIKEIPQMVGTYKALDQMTLGLFDK
tara:strand:- start:791 stop:1174 length:384 start_codon:yes stop_codon:yes gene_type:complete